MSSGERTGRDAVRFHAHPGAVADRNWRVAGRHLDLQLPGDQEAHTGQARAVRVWHGPCRDGLAPLPDQVLSDGNALRNLRRRDYLLLPLGGNLAAHQGWRPGVCLVRGGGDARLYRLFAPRLPLRPQEASSGMGMTPQPPPVAPGMMARPA